MQRKAAEDDTLRRLRTVRQRIAMAADDAGRQAEAICLLAVSKGQPLERIRAAHAAGQQHFGESYLQEAQQKIEQLADADIRWHFVGRLQSNKISTIARLFTWVHSLCDTGHARKLSRKRPLDQPPLNVCIQVNLSGETSKSGLPASALAGFAQTVATLPGLRLRGLMTMPNPHASEDRQRADFQTLARLHQELNQQGLALDTLSMGMSNDYPLAIASGATIVRIGTAIFGPRGNRL